MLWPDKSHWGKPEICHSTNFHLEELEQRNRKCSEQTKAEHDGGKPCRDPRETLERPWAGPKLKVLSGYRLLLLGVVLKYAAAVLSPALSPKLKQVSDEFVVLYSEENNVCIGGVQCVTSSGAPC